MLVVVQRLSPPTQRDIQKLTQVAARHEIVHKYQGGQRLSTSACPQKVTAKDPTQSEKWCLAKCPSNAGYGDLEVCIPPLTCGRFLASVTVSACETHVFCSAINARCDNQLPQHIRTFSHQSSRLHGTQFSIVAFKGTRARFYRQMTHLATCSDESNNRLLRICPTVRSISSYRSRPSP